MRLSLILAHPDPASFNHAIAQACSAELTRLGHTVTVHDLYAERFDPILTPGELRRDAVLPEDVAKHCGELAGADGLVFVHPNWWGQPPAILKGWIDRVLRPGVAYRFLEGDAGEGVPVGLLRARRALVFNTSNTEPGREQRVFGDPLEGLWRRCMLEFCGVSEMRREVFTVVVTSTADQRAAWLQRVAVVAREAFPAAVAAG